MTMGSLYIVSLEKTHHTVGLVEHIVHLQSTLTRKEPKFDFDLLWRYSKTLIIVIYS